MKYLLVILSAFFVGCASNSAVPLRDDVLQLGASDVSVVVNDVDAKSDDIINAFPDAMALQSLFLDEINRSLREQQERKPLPLLPTVDKIESDVTYNRRYTLVKGGVSMPVGSYVISGLSESGDVIWQEKMDDIVVHGSVFINILDVYKVPVGQFKQEEEEKYLTIWAQYLADSIYESQRDKAIEMNKANSAQ
jgi:hypothetical protein